MDVDEQDSMEVVVRKLRTLSKINVERMVRSKADVDLICQLRYEMLLYKAQMDTLLIMLKEKYALDANEYAKRHIDYLQALVEELQLAMHVRILSDGRLARW